MVVTLFTLINEIMAASDFCQTLQKSIIDKRMLLLYEDIRLRSQDALEIEFSHRSNVQSISSYYVVVNNIYILLEWIDT